MVPSECFALFFFLPLASLSHVNTMTTVPTALEDKGIGLVYEI